MSTATVDTETGEILAVQKYDPRAYLASLNKSDGLAVQKQLAAAYDAACAALIGPNDVQIEGDRSFKKKSAWRKLARYFNISVEIVRVEREVNDGDFVAIVTARAVAPWGQQYEEVGACSQSEATGRRTITIADAIATASTRASNRAVSNLIAMGEVSAEEIGDRGSRPAPRASSGGNAKGATMPFGKSKGKPLSEVDAQDLQGALDWAVEKGKFTEFQDAARKELASRNGATQDADYEVVDDEAGLRGSDDDSGLPF